MGQPNPNKQVAILQALNLLLNVLASVLAAYLLVLLNGVTWLTITSIIILTLIVLGLSIAISTQQRIAIQIRKASYWVIVIIVLSLIVPATVQAWLNAKPPTNYFVIDATDKTKSLFDDIRTNIQPFVSDAASHKNGFGLRIYGGKILGANTNGFQGCEDNTQLILQPNFYSDASKTVNEKLESINPIGNGSLLIAVQKTLDDDIANYEVSVNLVIVTTGTYTECLSLTKGYSQLLMSKISNIRKKILLDIFIYSIGKLDSPTAEILDGYAREFSGCHVNVLNPSNLSQAMELNESYCSSYPVVRPTPTLTP